MLVGVLFAAILPLQGVIVEATDWRLVVSGLILLYLGFGGAAVGAWILIGWITARFGER